MRTWWFSPWVNICPGSPARSSRTGSSRRTAPSCWWRWASTRRGWTGCWGTSACPPAPCWTAGTLRPSETAKRCTAQWHTRTQSSSLCLHARTICKKHICSCETGNLQIRTFEGRSPSWCVQGPPSSGQTRSGQTTVLHRAPDIFFLRRLLQRGGGTRGSSGLYKVGPDNKPKGAPPQQKARFNEAISVWIDFTSLSLSLPLTHASENNNIFSAIQNTRVVEGGVVVVVVGLGGDNYL